jgi:ubiquinone/menaquinone biosynthesis C-methylase UbiE
MAHPERWQLEGDEPRRYEQYKVPQLFRPLAERFIEHLGLGRCERVLDVACGTGIVARLAAPLVGPEGRVVGIDLNAGMLAVAAGCEPQSGAVVEWREADAQALPFPRASFDTVLCQQGLQFFPDRIGALREMHRVLAPDGRLALNVWGAQNPYLRALSQSLSMHVSANAAARSLAPLGLNDANALRSLVQGSGFCEVAVHVATISRRMRDLRETLPLEIAGTPFALEVCAASDAVRAAMVADMTTALQAYRDGEGYAVPAEAYFLTARANPI